MVKADYSEGTALKALHAKSKVAVAWKLVKKHLKMKTTTVHGITKKLISGNVALDKGYPKKKFKVPGVGTVQLRIHLLYHFQKIHKRITEKRELEDKAQNVIQVKWYNAIVDGKDMRKEGLAVSHLTHDKMDLGNLCTDPIRTNTDRSNSECFASLVCLECKKSIAYPCPHNPPCRKVVVSSKPCSSCLE